MSKLFRNQWKISKQVDVQNCCVAVFSAIGTWSCQDSLQRWIGSLATPYIIYSLAIAQARDWVLLRLICYWTVVVYQFVKPKIQLFNHLSVIVTLLWIAFYVFLACVHWFVSRELLCKVNRVMTPLTTTGDVMLNLQGSDLYDLRLDRCVKSPPKLIITSTRWKIESRSHQPPELLNL